MAVSVPHSGNLPFTLTDGKEIIVDGVVPPNCERFSINLCSGPTYDSDTALHFNPRFDLNEVVRTHQSGGWGQEEKHGGFPFQKGTPYQLKILVRPQGYQIYVNNTHFCDFNHRLAKETAKYIYITGDTAVNRISFAEAPIVNPPVPFTTPILGGLYPGRMIFINGVPTGGASRFNINLLCGPSFDDSDISLHFDARFNFGNSQKCVVRTHRAGGNWGGEETEATYFPFVENAPFEVIILVEAQKYKVAVNNQHFIEFTHRIHDLHRINYLNVQGDVRLTQIRFQ